MSVRKRKWRDKQGRQHERYMVHIEHTWPNGRKQTIRKVSPVQSKRGAEKYERELRQRLASGQWEEESKRQKIPTLAEFSERFLAYQATINKPGVVEDRRRILRVHLLPAFGKTKLDEIDVASVDDYKVRKLQEPSPYTGKPLAARTINSHLKVLSRMLHVARRWGLIREQPEFEHLKVRDTSFDFLDFDEADQLIAATGEHQPGWQAFVVVGIRTGLRVGEILALRWDEDVDLERGRIRVQQSLTKGGKFQSTKNDEIREVPLSWDARAQFERRRETSTGELVFPGLNGAPSNRTTTNDMLSRVTEKIGMRHIHNHIMRHSFASHAVMRGIPLRQVQEWLGHKSITQTMRYAHLAAGHGDDLIHRLAGGPPQHQTGRRDGAAKPQHMGGTRKARRSKSPSDRPSGP